MIRKKAPATVVLSLSILIALFFPVEFQAQQAETTLGWTIIETYEIPGKASGLAWDGTYLYFGIYGSSGSDVYRFDPDQSTFELLFTNPDINDSYGMTFDGSNLWITDHGLSSSVPAWALELDLEGNSISQFNLPDHYMSGIAHDEGNFWVCTYYPDPGTVYKVDNAGFELSSFTPPGEQPWDICLEGDSLWIADYYDDMLYKTDKEGNLLESQPCENTKPAGVVFDGQHLWYVDGGLGSPSKLYKVDLYGSGTPAIEVPVSSYNFGTVTVGDSASWFCSVSNSGTADLELTEVVVQNAVPIFLWEAFPIVIGSGEAYDIEFRYKPTEPGMLNTTATIHCNDPVNPEIELFMEGEAVFDGPHIVVEETQHDYGIVRVHATTRWYLEIFNDGNNPLEITNIEFTGDAFFLDESIELPQTINTLETRQLGIWFSPDVAGSENAIVTVTHNDITQEAIEVNLTGMGDDTPYPTGSDFWSYTITTSYDNSIKALCPIEDVSNDGIDDLVVCSEDDYIRCFNGNASGLADILWENEAGSVYGQNGLTTLEDIDGDDYREVVVGLAWGVRAIKVLSGKTGEQIWMYDTHVFGDGGWVYQVWTGADYNGDGTHDVLAASGNDGNDTGPKRIFCLDGIDGTVVWDTYTFGPGFSCMGVSDFTGDGIADVVAGASINNETEGKVYGIDGSDGLILWTFSTIGSSVWALEQLDDISGDDIPDIIAGDFSGNYYFLDATNGAFIDAGTAGNNLLLRFERLDDVNNDGNADIALASSGTNAIVVDGMTGDNIWFTALNDKCWNIDRIMDISGDGTNDLIAGTLFTSNYCYFLDGATGEIIHSINYGEPVDAIAAIPDINNDGTWELVSGGRNGTLTCYSSGPLNLLQAAFAAEPTAGAAPLTVQFLDESLGDISSWAWDFENDGVVDATDQNPEFTYMNSGTYSVELTVSDGNNTHTLLKEDFISVDTSVSIARNPSIFEIAATPNPFQNGTTISINLSVSKLKDIRIYDLDGNLVKSFHLITLSTNNQQINWNGTDNNLRPVPPGMYVLVCEAETATHHLKLIKR